jgi:hypothetical protein
MRLLVSGSREYTNNEHVLSVIKSLNPTVIIHGACPNTVDCEIRRFVANWNEYGLRAGPIRNERMIIEGRPDHALLFLSKTSKGTANTLALVKRYKIPHTIVHV